MLAQRSKTPYHFEDYQKETDFQKISSKKMRLGAYSIQDRYSIKNTARTKSETSLNVQQTTKVVKKISKNSNFQTLLPKIDIRMSTQAVKKQFYKAFNQDIKAIETTAKKRLIEPFTLLSNFQIKQKHGAYFVSHEGSRIKNEDRISIQEFEVKGKIYIYYGIFDGHCGHLAASFMAVNLHLILKQALEEGLDPSSALKQSLLVAEQKLKKNPRLAHKSGTCALICLQISKQCWIANVGDSRMLSIHQDGQMVQITRDHKPQDEEERRRIQYYGGAVSRHSSNNKQLSCQILPFRVYPGSLSVSRTIGDIALKKKSPNLVIALPDIYHLTTQKIKCLLLFTDGLYQKFTNKEICQLFLSPQTKTKASIKKLYDEASNRESTDNRSLIYVEIH